MWVFFLLYKTTKKDFSVVCLVIDTQYDVTMWEEQKSDPLASATREPPFHCASHIVTSYCVSITELTAAKSYLFVE